MPLGTLLKEVRLVKFFFRCVSVIDLVFTFLAAAGEARLR